MYYGYVARFLDPDPRAGFDRLVAQHARPLFAAHYRTFVSHPSYAPPADHSLSTVSFLLSSHTTYTLLAGLNDRRRPRTPVAVLAVHYLREGAAPGGKFNSDYQAAWDEGADRCVELEPKQLLRQMFDAFWA